MITVKYNKSNKIYTLLANVKDLYKESYLIRMYLLGLILFNVVMRYGIHFINLMNEFYNYLGL